LLHPVSINPEKLPSLCQCQAYPYHDAATTMFGNREAVTQLCVGFGPNIQDKMLISLPTFFQFYSTLLQTGCMFWNICILYRLPSFHYVRSVKMALEGMAAV
jgi:hypothetical protein